MYSYSSVLLTWFIRCLKISLKFAQFSAGGFYLLKYHSYSLGFDDQFYFAVVKEKRFSQSMTSALYGPNTSAFVSVNSVQEISPSGCGSGERALKIGL